MSWDALVLAAGRSARMGQSKPHLPWRGATLLTHAVRTVQAASVQRTLVVVSESVDDSSWRDGVALIRRQSDSMMDSIQHGLNELSASHSGNGVLIHLCDLPLVTPDDLSRLMASPTTQQPVAAAAFEETFGPPIAFSPPSLQPFRAFLGKPSRRDGAKSYLRSLGETLRRVSIPAAAYDCDTPDDYEALVQKDRQTGTVGSGDLPDRHGRDLHCRDDA